MSNNSSSSSSGLGLFSVLTIIFVVLKLVGVINWSWWLVLLPTFIGIGLWLIVAVVFAIWVVHDDKKCGTSYTKRKKDKWKF